MNSNYAMVSVKLGFYDGALKDTNISDCGLVHSIDEKRDTCYVGEIDYDTSRAEPISELRPMVLKEYYTNTPAPAMPKLRFNTKQYKQAHDDWKKTFVEIPIEKQTAILLVRRIGYKKLRPPQDSIGLMESMDNIAHPMIEINNLMGMLIVKNEKLRLSDKSSIANIHLQKAIQALSSTLWCLDVDLDNTLRKLDDKERESLIKKMNSLNKILNGK